MMTSLPVCSCPPMATCERHGVIKQPRAERPKPAPKRRGGGLRKVSEKKSLTDKIHDAYRDAFIFLARRYDDMRCWVCGIECKPSQLDLHHDTRRGQGGKHRAHNYLLVCNRKSANHRGQRVTDPTPPAPPVRTDTLRALAGAANSQGWAATATALYDAADEIERLRSEVDKGACWRDTSEQPSERRWPLPLQRRRAEMGSIQQAEAELNRDKRISDLEAEVTRLTKIEEAAQDLAERIVKTKSRGRYGSTYGHDLRYNHESELGGVNAVDRFLAAALTTEPTPTEEDASP